MLEYHFCAIIASDYRVIWALVVKWTSRQASNLLLGVRVPPRAKGFLFLLSHPATTCGMRETRIPPESIIRDKRVRISRNESFVRTPSEARGEV